MVDEGGEDGGAESKEEAKEMTRLEVHEEADSEEWERNERQLAGLQGRSASAPEHNAEFTRGAMKACAMTRRYSVARQLSYSEGRPRRRCVFKERS